MQQKTYTRFYLDPTLNARDSDMVPCKRSKKQVHERHAVASRSCRRWWSTQGAPERPNSSVF